MTIGNVLALLQHNIKRMLAYSGVAHAGYMLVGLLIGPRFGDGLLGDGVAAMLYYAVIYGIANLGAFALLGMLRAAGQPCETLRDVAGLLRRQPGLAWLMALAMFTLMGLPPTAGFWGKVGLFGGALAGVAREVALTPYDRSLVLLVVIGMLNTALAAAYYLRVIAAVLLYESDHPAEPVPEEAPRLGAVLCGFLLLLLAFYPAALWEPSRRATADLRGAALARSVEASTAPQPPRAGLGARAAARGPLSNPKASEGSYQNAEHQ
jgi:NADH-quinone oxidoreductase subunit N